MTKLENQGDSEAMDCSEEAGTYGLRGHHIFGLSDILYNTGDLVTLVHILVASNGLRWPRRPFKYIGKLYNLVVLQNYCFERGLEFKGKMASSSLGGQDQRYLVLGVSNAVPHGISLVCT